MMTRAVSATTALVSVVLFHSACGRNGNANDVTLRFNSDGTFKIVQFTDTQDDQDVDPRTVQLIEAVLNDQHPDLVVFTGDNISSGPENPDEVRAAIGNVVEPVDSRGIPWLITFGNHDEDHTAVTGVGASVMLQYYMSFPHNINRPSDEGVHGTSNMHVLILGSQAQDPVFNIWALDAGHYSPDTIGGQAIANDSLPGWDWIKQTQVSWYYESSVALEERFGYKVPSLMFFHIPLWEFHHMWEQREHHDVSGEKNEPVSSGPFNSGLFTAMLERGDVVGVFVGHDHVNDYVGNYFGIRLGYAANSGFGAYGLDGSDRDRMRGARVFALDENDPARFKTYMVYARDYGI